METRNYFGEYLAPEVKVIEMEGQGMLCSSTQDMPVDTPFTF